jgi:hypothetical protein
VLLLGGATDALATTLGAVTVRVEGLTETKLLPTQVTTAAAPFSHDGNPAHSCPGTSALNALQLATGGNWGGPWSSGFKQYEIYSIEGELHEFELGAPANYFWSFWLDEKEATAGACEKEVQPGDRVLFFPSCYGEKCPPAPAPLGIEAPLGAEVGETAQVTVRRYGPKGEASPVEGASVTGGSGVSPTTDAVGHTTVTFSAPGNATLRVSAPGTVRTEATVCVHKGNDGTCGTAGPSGSSSGGGTGGVAGYRSTPYTGPYAVVAKAVGVIDSHVYSRQHAPRLLAGTVLAHTSVASVSLELRRSYKGHCFAYDGVSIRFRRARCGRGTFFKVSTMSSFSYLLPSALAPGRYVLDIEATDAAGNHTKLARGTSRVVFYVR